MTSVSKYLNPSRYAARLRSYLDRAHRAFYRKLLHDGAGLNALEDQKFANASLDMRTAQSVLNVILQGTRGRDFDFNNDSIHWLVFSALSLSSTKIVNILEVGTFEGEFTAILARLFPEATITTVDLPASDPLLRDFYNREEDSAFQKYKNTQKGNLASKNIRLLETNSIFLLDKVNEKFDLIWVDAGHLYPEVAWDLCNAYYLCSSGGAVLCDDVIPLKNSYKDRYVSTESFEVLEYLRARTSIELTLFLKRRAPHFFAKKVDRKYVAYLRKP